MKSTYIYLTLLVAVPMLVAAQEPPAPPTPPTPPTPPSRYSYHNQHRHRHDDEDDDSDHDGDNDGVTIDTTFAFSGSGGVIDLGIVSGQITVHGWSRNEAKIHATSEEGRIEFEHSSSRILLDVRNHHGGDSDFEVTVPIGTRVLMRSTAGDLHADGVKGPMEARTVSGEVGISDVTGDAIVDGVSGDIEIRNVEGNLRVNSVSGEIQLANIHGDVDAQGVSGDITLPNGQSHMVRMESVSGNLTYGGTISSDGRYDFHSHSGDVTLRVPGDVGASLGMETFSGSIESEFRVVISADSGDRRGSGQHIETTLGHGGAHITIETFSGDIRLQRLTSHGE
jgi:DUF4097 and DUF4098 domain-containing protein YvlB